MTNKDTRLNLRITWDNLLERIKDQPVEHLGGFSPRLLSHYFTGYGHALQFHRHLPIQGAMGLFEFSRWFSSHAYAGPPGWTSYCLLLTTTEEAAIELFFEFRQIAKTSDWTEEHRSVSPPTNGTPSFMELLRSDALRDRPAMYFGNWGWVQGIWAMWHGYVSAERDIGAAESIEVDTFRGFEEWLKKRFEFAQGANFGKIFEFLSLGVKEKALELFFDHLEIFLDGCPPNQHTNRFQALLDVAVESVREDQQK